jgi:hypothetical protein
VSNGTYIFARFADRRELDELSRQLISVGRVKRWDAIDGYFQLAVRLAESGESVLPQIRSLHGLTEAVDCPITVDDEHECVLNADTCHSYLLIEAVPERLESIRHTICGQEQVLFCSATEGPCNLVAIISGQSFGEIDRLVDKAITPLDGVLRLKQNRILSSIAG